MFNDLPFETKIAIAIGSVAFLLSVVGMNRVTSYWDCWLRMTQRIRYRCVAAAVVCFVVMFCWMFASGLTRFMTTKELSIVAFAVAVWCIFAAGWVWFIPSKFAYTIDKNRKDFVKTEDVRRGDKRPSVWHLNR